MNSTETSPKLTKSLEDRQNLSAGHQAMMLQNTRRKLRDNWKNTKAYRQHMLAGALGKTPQEIDGDGASEEDENMLRDALVLGNVTITQSAQLPQEKRTEQSLLAPESPAVQRSEPPAPMSTAAKIGMAAAIASGLGIPLSIALATMGGKSEPQQPPPIVQAVDPDGQDVTVDIFGGAK